MQQHAGKQQLFFVVPGSPNRFINHPIFRWSQCIQGMVNGGSEGYSRKRKKESAEAGECGETKKRSTKRHFGITSRKGGEHSARNSSVLLVGRNDEQMGPKLKQFQT